jgi:hypothetical protein
MAAYGPATGPTLIRPFFTFGPLARETVSLPAP